MRVWQYCRSDAFVAVNSLSRDVGVAPTTGWLRIIFLTGALILTSCTASVTEPVSYFAVETPRPFGYVIGDEIAQRIVIETRPGIILQAASLPARGQINRWLNLTQINVEQQGEQTVINLRYQVFYAPLEVKMLTLPGFTLQFAQGDKLLSKDVPDWSFTVAPLRELAVRKNEQHEYMRPDGRPPLLSDSAAQMGLWSSFSVSVLLGTYLAYLYGYFPQSRRRVFKQALKQLATLSETDMAQALTIAHKAFNKLNRQPLFQHQLTDFYRQHSDYQRINKPL
ncbi:MAG: nonribosomal peptide synthetase MxaA, partial [Methylobacter sp.]|nr:nonribosomal peptide synthetase MxaA [Methylobacter sp.]